MTEDGIQDLPLMRCFSPLSGNTAGEAVRKHAFCKMPLWKRQDFDTLAKKSYSEFLPIHSSYSREITQKTKAPCGFSRIKGGSEDGGSNLGLLNGTASSLMPIYLFALCKRGTSGMTQEKLRQIFQRRFQVAAFLVPHLEKFLLSKGFISEKSPV